MSISVINGLLSIIVATNSEELAGLHCHDSCLGYWCGKMQMLAFAECNDALKSHFQKWYSTAYENVLRRPIRFDQMFH